MPACHPGRSVTLVSDVVRLRVLDAAGLGLRPPLAHVCIVLELRLGLFLSHPNPFLNLLFFPLILSVMKGCKLVVLRGVPEVTCFPPFIYRTLARRSGCLGSAPGSPACFGHFSPWFWPPFPHLQSGSKDIICAQDCGADGKSKRPAGTGKASTC